MSTDPNDRAQEDPDQDQAADQPGGTGRVRGQETKPAEEWGERLDTGKTIARGGKEHGATPGAEPDRG